MVTMRMMSRMNFIGRVGSGRGILAENRRGKKMLFFGPRARGRVKLLGLPAGDLDPHQPPACRHEHRIGRHEPAPADRAVIEPAGDVGRAALLPALEHERAHAPEFLALRFEPLVDVALRAIERERQDAAALSSRTRGAAG